MPAGGHAGTGMDAPAAGVIVCHGAGGVTAHHRDVARRLAKAGHAAPVPDLLSREGGSLRVPPAERGAALAAPGTLARHVADVHGADGFLIRRGVAADRPAVLGFGFGFGGLVAWSFAAAAPVPRALVADDALPSPVEQVDLVRAAILVHVGGQSRAAAPAPGPKARLRDRPWGAPWAVRVHRGAGRGFFDDAGARSGGPAA